MSQSRGKQIGQLMMTTVGNEFLLSLLLIVVGVALKARNSEICGNMYDESNYADNKKKKKRI